MVVDTSALVSVLRNEDDADDYNRKLFEGFPRRISAANYLELCMVMSSGEAEEAFAKVDNFLDKAEIEIVPITAYDALIAREAFRKFGKGRHPAQLNFGDCFSYALAKRLSEPLLFKGNDFIQTDILIA